MIHNNKITRIILAALLLTAASLNGISCRGGAAIPQGWSSHSFKLTEHPETIVGGEKVFKALRGRSTITDDTREGFMMGERKELSFEVFLPSMGKVRFAYGYGPGLFDFGENLTFTVNAAVEGGNQVLGYWEIEKIEKGQDGKWVAAEANIPPDAAGNIRLTFSLSGLNRPAPGRAFFLAHPSIVTRSDGGQRKRVIWVSIDTLRPDHMGCYGYKRPTTPNIDAFAAESTIFQRCIAESPWTLPSYAAMFTGRYPSITGATTNVRFLPEAERTLTQILSKEDMATLSVYNVGWVGISSGLDRGFDASKLFRGDYADASYNYAREWMLNHADEDCFVFIHVYDPHLPYKPKEKYRDTFDPEYQGRYKYAIENYDGLMMGIDTVTDREKTHIEALYDEDVLGCDADTGDFINFLKENGFYKDSLIIINSDHGEEFWEHGGYAHGHQLYDEVIRVPLLIRGPGFEKGRKVNRMCAGFDIFPTILEWLDMEVPDNINAESLFEIIDGGQEQQGRMHLCEELYFGTEQKGVSTEQYHYILHTIDRSEELYDVAGDPQMHKNIADVRRDEAQKLRYFVTEYTLNKGAGWHARIYRTPKDNRKGEKYVGRITSPSGFAEAKPTKLGPNDTFEVKGNELQFTISIGLWEDKAFDFRTNNETDQVQFEILTDGEPDAEQFVFLGPNKVAAPSTSFTLTILDPIFGLGMPQFGPQGPKHHGLYLWGNSNTLREKTAPQIDERTREELRSLGYLH